jgi:hypothetical protein
MIADFHRAIDAVPAQYFEAAARVATIAESRATSPLELHLALDGLRLRIRHLYPAVLPALRPALRHLEVNPPTASDQEPDFTIVTWEQTADLPPAPAPHPVMRETAKKHLLLLGSDQRYRAFDEDWLGTRTWIDFEQRIAYYCVRSAAALPYYETAAPLRALLNAVLSRHGRQLVHASAVGDAARGGLLLVGAGGSGKSSTALRCLGTRLGHLADDWCVITPGSPPRLASAYSSAKLRPANLVNFPSLAARVHNYDKLDEEKATVFLHEHFPESLLTGCRARAILAPVVADREDTVVERVPGPVAWRAMVSCSLEQLPGVGRESLALMTAFSARLPAYWLHLGRDFAAIPGVLDRLLDTLAT